ncbi:hypothetical protein M5K25_009860 [Dendrobium thyrsiflorum]|uniref:Uncharacterized protein n=1 Tax=Dendrobium thyrsiflorum TaxID=117978 RepID=A0ABD0V6T1_DENTH
MTARTHGFILVEITYLAEPRKQQMPWLSWSLIYLVRGGSRPNLTEGTFSAAMGCFVGLPGISLQRVVGRAIALSIRTVGKNWMTEGVGTLISPVLEKYLLMCLDSDKM